MLDYEWLADQLVKTEYVENGPQLEKDECQKVLDLVSKNTGKAHMLIVNVNIESNSIYYDYLLDESETNEVHIEEWDNRYL